MKKHTVRYNEGDAILKAIVATVVVAIVTAGVVYIILKRNMKTESGPPLYNEAEKLEILKQLAESSKSQPGTVERSRILESLVSESGENQ